MCELTRPGSIPHVADRSVVGSGFQLALACDIRVADADAVFTMPETSLGLVPDLGGTPFSMNLWATPAPSRFARPPTGRRHLITAAISTEVCGVAPALHARSDRYDVAFVADGLVFG
jgi:hypothetical protein